MFYYRGSSVDILQCPQVFHVFIYKWCICWSDPLPPEKLTVDRASTTTSSIRVTWVYDSDKTFIKQLLLRYAIQGLSQWQEEYISSLTDNTKVLYGLDAGQKYIVQVYGVTDFDIASITPIQVNATVSKYYVIFCHLDG